MPGIFCLTSMSYHNRVWCITEQCCQNKFVNCLASSFDLNSISYRSGTWWFNCNVDPWTDCGKFSLSTLRTKMRTLVFGHYEATRIWCWGLRTIHRCQKSRNQCMYNSKERNYDKQTHLNKPQIIPTSTYW